MFDVARELRLHVEPLARLEAIGSGKPIRDCRGEVAKVAEMFEYDGGWADKFYGDVIPVPSSHLNYTRREPAGTVLQIAPWNAPVFTCGWQVAPAIAMGNAVLLKPSEMTPCTSLVLARLAEKAGVPRGLINVFAGYGHTIGQAAIAHRAWPAPSGPSRSRARTVWPRRCGPARSGSTATRRSTPARRSVATG